MIHQPRPWDGKLAEVEEQRSRRKPPKLRIVVSEPGPKGRAPLRQCPADFDVIFVEIGRLDCEAWYRARRTTITRWLEECGKERLIRQRHEYVRLLRLQGKKPQGTPAIQVATDRSPPHPEVARQAAAFLRIRCNGGWMVSPTGHGDWFVGSGRKSAGEMVAMAEARGFDVARANLQAMAPQGVGNGHG